MEQISRIKLFDHLLFRIVACITVIMLPTAAYLEDPVRVEGKGASL
jgi:hypothetical protein